MANLAGPETIRMQRTAEIGCPNIDSKNRRSQNFGLFGNFNPVGEKMEQCGENVFRYL
jgi:hypothetical protein